MLLRRFFTPNKTDSPRDSLEALERKYRPVYVDDLLVADNTPEGPRIEYDRTSTDEEVMRTLELMEHITEGEG